MLGVKSDVPRRHDLAAVGAILAEIVRRREVGAWPIEDAPEWKALGRAGKAWLAYVNFLMDPQPAAGELTIAEARKRLRAIPKDANPARTAAIIGAAAMLVFAGGIAAFARFGNPIYMPGPVYQLAVTLRNPKAFREEVTPSWEQLVRAWDTWLGDLQVNAPRLLRNEKLWSGPSDPLRIALQDFSKNAENLKIAAVVPDVGNEKRVGVLINPPEDLRLKLRQQDVTDRINAAWGQVVRVAAQLEGWPRWKEMRDLQAILEARGFTRAVAALQPKLPPARVAGVKVDTQRTAKLFNDVSLDDNGTLLLASRWNAITKLKTDMEGTTGDRVQVKMPTLILERLRDTGSIGNFAESLGDPLDELTQRRARYMDPQVVKERFLAESPLLKETAEVTTADFPRWEEQLALFSKVPATDDPRKNPAIAQNLDQLPKLAGDLEDDAPSPEPGGLATLSTKDFANEFQQRKAELTALNAKEIVRVDLPKIGEETNGLLDRLHLLQQRIEATIILLKPETWLAKVAPPYGTFNETRQRWAAWQATFANVTADSLRGPANRQKFRDLRAQQRQIKDWIDGLQGPDGLGALTVPDLKDNTQDTVAALAKLELDRREQAASAVAAATDWRNAVPQIAWANATPKMREPIEAHRQWLAALPAFAADLDKLAELLAGGFGWNEGVDKVAESLAPRPGLDALTRKPAESVSESRLLGQLVASSDRGALVTAAQSGKLSRVLTAWRRLGEIAGWPANAADLDVDGGVVESLRQIVPATVTDEKRRASLLEELVSQTRVRWNHAARNSASNIEQMTAVFERMGKYNISEEDLEEKARYNFNLWQYKRSDWSEVEIPPLRQRKDDFLRKVRSIAGAMAEPSVKGFVDQLSDIQLVVDPNRKRTPSPRTANWKEEMTDAGLGLTATWKAGNKELKIDFTVIQPEGDLPPFYLARREIAVGEFLDLMAARPKDAEEVAAALPQWAIRTGALSKPFDQPMTWIPNPDTGQFELNQDGWFNYSYFTPQMKGLFDDKDDKLAQAFAEKPTLRSPLQQIPPAAAKIFVQKMLGARLPTLQEWAAVMKVIGSPETGNFRAKAFEDLFKAMSSYKKEGTTIAWRPTSCAFQVMVTPPGGGRKVPMADDGKEVSGTTNKRLWPAPVDEGPKTPVGNFVNLTGNVWIYLEGPDEQFYVAGGSILSPPGLDPTKPQKVEPRGLIGAKTVTEGFSDVGVRPAFDAPPGFKERYRLLVLVRQQQYLTW